MGGRSILAPVLALAVLAPTGRLGAAVWYLAGVANAGGSQGAHFASEVHVLNLGDERASVTFRLVPFDGNAPVPVSRTLAARGTFAARNVLDELWGLSGAGVLEVESDAPLSFRASTYNDAAPPGTFGTALTAVRHDELLEGEPFETRTYYVPWVSQSRDPGRDYRSNLLVFLATPYSHVNVALRGANIVPVSRAVFTEEAPRVVQIPMSELLPDEAPGTDPRLSYVTLDNLEGRAIVFASVVDNVTSDGIAVFARPLSAASTRYTVNGVARAGGLGGTFWRTDLRLCNPSLASSSIKVRVTPIGFDGAPAELDVRQNEVREVVDVLGTLFSAPEGTTGALRLEAEEPILVAARTSNVKRSGEPGTFGAYQAPVVDGDFLFAGQRAVLPGLTDGPDVPGFRTNVGFVSLEDGALLRLTLNGPDGKPLGVVPELRLEPRSWRQPSLGALFPGLDVPPESSLVVEPLEGAADVYASVIDNATGDAVVSTPDRDLPVPCIPPELRDVSLSPPWTGPGTFPTLWVKTSGATSVTLDPQAAAVTIPVGFGRFAFNAVPAASLTARVTAAGPCGSTAREVSIPVGPPAIEVLTPEASPGALVRVRLVGVFAPEAITGLLVRFDDGWTFEATVAPTPSGEASFVVPFVQDGAAPRGYRTGPARIAYPDETYGGGEAPMTILPLAYAGNAPAALLGLLDDRAAQARAAFERFRAVPELAPAVPAMEETFLAYDALLRKVASDLAAGGTAELPSDLPTAAQPAPPAATVTRDDLSAFVALVTNVRASLAVSSPGSLRRLAPPVPETGCASSDPLVFPCLAAHEIDIEGGIDWFAGAVAQAFAFGKDGAIVELAVKAALGALLSSWIAGVEAARAPCVSMPVWVRNFIPTPSQTIPNGGRDVVFEAYMENLTTSENAADYLTQRFVDTALRLSVSKLPSSVRGPATETMRRILAGERKGLEERLRALFKSWGGVRAESHRARTCQKDYRDWWFVKGGKSREFGHFLHWVPTEDKTIHRFNLDDPFAPGIDVFVLQPARGRLLSPLSLAEVFQRGPGTGTYEVALLSEGAQPGAFPPPGTFSVGMTFQTIVDVSGSAEVVLEPATLLSPPGRRVITAHECPCGKPCTLLNGGGRRPVSMTACSDRDRSYRVTLASGYSDVLSGNLARYRRLGFDFRLNAANGLASVHGKSRFLRMPIDTSIDGGAKTSVTTEQTDVSNLRATLTAGFVARDAFQVTGSQRIVDRYVDGRPAGQGSGSYTFELVPKPAKPR